MAAGKVIGRVEVSVGNVKIVDVDGNLRDVGYDDLMYEGEQIYSDDVNTLFQIKYLALPEATAYDGIFRVFADGSVVSGLDGNENLFGDDIDFLDTAAGGAVQGSSAFLEEVASDEGSSLLDFSRGADDTGYGLGITDYVVVADTGDQTPPVITSLNDVVFDENNPDAVMQITADDMSAVSFSIDGLDSDLFSIDPQTGVLTFNELPDYENPQDLGGDNEYNLYVTVTDAVGNYTTQLISINVNNLNDNAPTADDGENFATEDVYDDVNGDVVGGDADGNEIRYELVEGVGEDEGYLNFGEDGSYTYNVGTDFQDLAHGETREVTFTYKTVEVGPPLSEPSDAGPFESEEATVTITVTGTNDQPVVSDINANGTSEVHGETVSGTLLNDVHEIAANGEGSVGYTYFTVEETTTLTVDATSTGDSFIDTYLYILRNDGDLSTDDYVTHNDDWYGLNSHLSIVLQPGEYIAAVGDFYMSIGEVVNGINNENSQGEITLTFTANHDITLHDTNAINNVIYESHDAIDVIGVEDTQADALTTFTGVVDTVTDVDTNDTHTYAVVEGSANGLPEGATATIAYNEATGNWEYTIEGDFNYLDMNETTTVTFDYVAIDSSGVGAGGGADEPDTSEPATITLTLTGTNDQPIVADVTTVVSEASLLDDMVVDGERFPMSRTNAIPMEDSRYVGSVASALSDDDGVGEDTHTFAMDEGSLTLSITTANQAFLSLFNLNDLQSFENFVEDMSEGALDVSFMDEDDNGVADSLTLTTLEIPQEFVEVMQQYGILNIAMNEDGTYSVQSPLFNLLGAHDSVTVGFDYRATDSAGITGEDANNELSESEAATVTLTIMGTNDQPVAYEASYEELESALDNTAVGDVNATFTGSLPGADSGSELIDVLTRSGIMGEDGMDEDILDTVTLTFNLDEDALVTTTGEEVVDATQTQVVVNEDGTFSVTNPTFDNLAEGESATVTFQYYIDDESGALATEGNPHESSQSDPVEVTVTIVGTNDTPVLNSVTTDTSFMETDLTGTPWGNPARPENSYLSGTLVADVSDDDTNDSHQFVELNHIHATVDDPNGVIHGNVKVSLDADGNYRVWNPSFNKLSDGESVTVSFAVQVTDGASGEDGESPLSNTQIVTLTITGTNDQPVVHNVHITVAEADLAADVGSHENAVFEGTLVSTDEDTNNTNPHYRIVGDVEVSHNVVGITASDITLSLNHGGWNASGDYTISSDKFNSLREGETLRVTFDYKASDWEGFGRHGDGVNEASHSDVKTVTLTIVGTNDAAIISPIIATGTVVEDLPFTAQGYLEITDEDYGQAHFDTNFVANSPTSYGTFVMNESGHWTYELDPVASQAVGANGAVETFTVSSADGTATQLITINIYGNNDAPVATSETISVVADVATATASISPNHVYDDMGSHYSVVQDAQGDYGIDQTGWGFDSDSEIDSLGRNEHIRFTFAHAVTSAEISYTNFDSDDNASYRLYMNGNPVSAKVYNEPNGTLSIPDGVAFDAIVIYAENADGNNLFHWTDFQVSNVVGYYDYDYDTVSSFTVESETLLANDTDVEGDTLTVGLVDGVLYDTDGNPTGTVTLDANGDVQVTPNAGEEFTNPVNEYATFNYTVDDGNGGVSTATATINVRQGSLEEGQTYDPVDNALVVEAGDTLDLSNVSSISVVQLGEGTMGEDVVGDDGITITAADVLDATDDGMLVINSLDGDASDQVVVDSSLTQVDNIVGADGTLYAQYTGEEGAATLLIEIDDTPPVDVY